MRRIILTLLIAFFASNYTFAGIHKSDTVKRDYTFLGHPNFKDGKARVTFEAIYYDIHRSAPAVIVKNRPEYPYQYKTLLNERIYSDTEIGFTIQGDLEALSAPLVCNCSIVNHLKTGDIIYLTCTVFKDYKDYNHKSFYVVQDVITKRPKN
jgi:hypothetical protein